MMETRTPEKIVNVNLPTETPSTSNLESNTFKDNPTEIPTLSETKSLIHETELEESDESVFSIFNMKIGSSSTGTNPNGPAALGGTKKLPFHLQSSHTRLLIKNGTVVNAHKTEEMDVYLEDGIIKQLGRNMIIPGGTRTIDAKGMYIIPGGIDAHTHLEFEFMGEKSVDDFYTGTKAAIVGGTTTILDFAIPQKDESLIQTYMKYRKLADGKVCCDYGLHMGVTAWNESVKQEIMDLCKMYGVNSFKIFLAYKDLYMINDEEMYHVFETCKELGAIAMVHAENGTLIKENTKKLLKAGTTGPEGHELSRPEEVEAEAEAVFRACVFANQVECPLYVVHVMSKSAANVLAAKRREKAESPKKNKLFGETLVAAVGTYLKDHICLNFQDGAAHVLGPPLRPDPSTPTELLKLLASDGLQVVSSYNCTFNVKQKALGLNDFSKIPNGVNGVEDRMSIVWEKGVTTGILTPEQFVAVTSTNAAKIFNIYPKKGCISVGADADIVIWNPKKTRKISSKTHHQAVDYNIFEGTVCHGVADYVIVKGRICVEEAEVKPTLSRGLGEFLQTPVYSPFVYPDAVPNKKSNQLNLEDDLVIKDYEVAVNSESSDLNPGDTLLFSRDSVNKMKPVPTTAPDSCNFSDASPSDIIPAPQPEHVATESHVPSTTNDARKRRKRKKKKKSHTDIFEKRCITIDGRTIVKFDDIEEEFVIQLRNLDAKHLESFLRIVRESSYLQQNVESLIKVFTYIQKKKMNIFMAFTKKEEISQPPIRSNGCEHYASELEPCDCVNTPIQSINKLIIEYKRCLKSKKIEEEVLQDLEMMFLIHSMILEGVKINPRTCATELLALKYATNIRWSSFNIVDLNTINDKLAPIQKGFRSENLGNVLRDTEFYVEKAIPKIINSGANPIVKASSVLGRLLLIQPFNDCNHRTARLLFNSVLRSFQIPCVIFPYETHDKFKSIIPQLRRTMDFTELQKFICELTLTSLIFVLEKVDCNKAVLNEVKMDCGRT